MFESSVLLANGPIRHLCIPCCQFLREASAAVRNRPSQKSSTASGDRCAMPTSSLSFMSEVVSGILEQEKDRADPLCPTCPVRSMTRRGRAPGTDREVVRSGRGLLRLLAANQPVNEQRNQLSPPPVRGRVEQVLVGGPGGVCVDSGLRATVFMVPIVSGGVSNGHSRRVPYPMPYRQMRLLEKARNFETVAVCPCSSS